MVPSLSLQRRPDNRGHLHSLMSTLYVLNTSRDRPHPFSGPFQRILGLGLLPQFPMQALRHCDTRGVYRHSIFTQQSLNITLFHTIPLRTSRVMPFMFRQQNKTKNLPFPQTLPMSLMIQCQPFLFCLAESGLEPTTSVAEDELELLIFLSGFWRAEITEGCHHAWLFSLPFHGSGPTIPLSTLHPHYHPLSKC